MTSDNEYVLREKARYARDLTFSFPTGDSDLDKMIDNSLTAAADAAVTAGFNGAMNDGGAGAKINELNRFMEGYLYGTNGILTGPYAKVIEKQKLLEDPEYQEMLRLQEKFKKVI